MSGPAWLVAVFDPFVVSVADVDALMLDPISMPIFWVGIALGVASLVIFAVMAKMGLNE